jgi:hypothetical protein
VTPPDPEDGRGWRRIAIQAAVTVGPLFGVIALMATLSLGDAALVGLTSAALAALVFGAAAVTGRGPRG